MRFAFIAAEKACFPVRALCRALRVSRAGFYAWQERAPSPHAQADDRLGLELALFTSAHVSEIVGAKVRDLSLDGDERVILNIRMKGNLDRNIEIVPEVATRLLAHLKEREARPDAPLLINREGQPYSRTAFSNILVRLARKAGVTRIPVHAHVLRHSAVTLAHSQGADVPTLAAMAGHRDLHTIQKYLHLSGQQGDVGRKMVYEALRGGD